MATRDHAARAYVRGDAGPLSQLVTDTAPATFFGPGGGKVEGPERVSGTYVRDAGNFADGESELEILQCGSDGDVGYWVGFQRATVTLKGKPEPVQMTLRVTEIFRREEGEWKLVHRHADMK